MVAVKNSTYGYLSPGGPTSSGMLGTSNLVKTPYRVTSELVPCVVESRPHTDS